MSADDRNFSWYVIRVRPGSEEGVVSSINEICAENHAFKECMREMFIPCGTTIRMQRGRKVNAKTKLFPGYIFVNVHMCSLVLDTVRHLNSGRTNGFVQFMYNATGIPAKVEESFIADVKLQVENGGVALLGNQDYEVGESVRIIEGPFQSFVGRIDSVHSGRDSVTVYVSIFGRPTRVDLEKKQIEKIYDIEE